MHSFAIVTDSSSDFTAHLRERFDIPDVMRGIVYFPDGHSELSDLDWEEHTPEWYYDSMKSRKVLYRTAAAPNGELERVFQKNLEAGKDILCICLSAALSGTYQNCCLMAEEMMKKYPQRKILCVDSMRYSTAQSLLVMMASMKRAEGATVEETAAYLEEKKYCVHQMGPMDDLFFLVKTGRINNFKAFFGTLAGVNPMADFNRQGMSEVLVKFKGKRAAFDATIRYMEKTIVDPENQIIFVAHSNRQAAAELLVQRVQETFHPKEVIINPVGMSCGATIGPGLCAAFYVGRPISEGLQEEKKIMDAIAADLKK